MKRLIVSLIIFVTIPFTYAQQTYVPDDNFEQALIDLGYDDVLDDYVITDSINTVTTLDVSNDSISDLTGIEDFTALTELRCYINQLTNLDVSSNTALTYLHCAVNQLTSLDVSSNTGLTNLNCGNNDLTSLDISSNTSLTNLNSTNNPLTTLDVSSNTGLTNLNCSNNDLTSLDVSSNTALTHLFLYYNDLTSLDVTTNTALTNLQFQYNQLTSLDVSSNTALTDLRCSDNQLTSLDVSNTNLNIFDCSSNQLNYLSIKGLEDQLNSFNATENDSLECIETLDPTYATANWTFADGNIDEGVIFSIDCLTPVYLGPVWYVATTGSDSTGDGSEENPFATIQKGVDVANDMDTVYVSNGIYEGGIVISNKAISLIGESREGTKINQPISSPQISIVDCQEGTTRVENFTIKQGSSNNGGGIYSSESTVEINSVDFINNSSSNNGAAINSIESTVKVQNSTFSHNTSDNLGGAIYVDPLTTCEIYNSSFDNNGALWGGAIATVGGGKLLVEGCNISFNLASGNNPNPNQNYPTFGGGGGIYQEWSDSLEIYDSEITNNTAATGAGGGIAVYLSDHVTINNIVLSNNSSSGPNYPSGGGGAAFYRADNVLFENSIIANNVSNHNSGGGIFLGSESGQASIVVHATFNGLTLVNNSALSGGAIFCWSAILNLYHSTIAQNEASNLEWSGGGLASHYVTEPNIISSLFYDNNPNSIHNGYPYTPVLVAYSLVQEQWAGWGNLTNVDPLFCDPDSGDYSLAENSPCVGAGQDGSNMGAYGIGCDPIILSISNELLPVTYILHQNYPNPFNPVTTLRYDLPENSLVNVTVYDMLGRQVKTLINQTQDAGYRSIVWDATNDYGKPVSAGIYLYQIQAGEYISTKKMILLK